MSKKQKTKLTKKKTSTGELLFSLTKKDFIVETFRAGGKGGQHQNKTDSAVRIKHPDSGAVGESREERSQPQNKKIAFMRLLEHPRFKVWHLQKYKEVLEGITLEEKVEKMMDTRNLKVEKKDEKGNWVDINVTSFEE